jgi:hypothetical protein
MNIVDEKRERELRAMRLVDARKRAQLGGPTRLAAQFGWNVNTYKAHESGRNGFGMADAKAYAKAFDVSLPWLFFNIGSMEDPFADTSELQQEIIDLFDALPPKLQAVQVEHLRKLVQAIRSGESPAADD